MVASVVRARVAPDTAVRARVHPDLREVSAARDLAVRVREEPSVARVPAAVRVHREPDDLVVAVAPEAEVRARAVSAEHREVADVVAVVERTISSRR